MFVAVIVVVDPIVLKYSKEYLKKDLKDKEI